jgi:sensor histidine kinase regulating citrate/malate metabolism
VLRHEFKNNILTRRVLSRTHQYDKLDRYLDNYLKTDGAALSHFDCGNKVLNNIINYKSADLTQKGTEFEINVSVPEELPFAESDITSLLVNLIDNAAEAAGMTEHPTVALKIIVEKSFCFITVSNTVLGDVLAENPDLLTTKQDKKGHGIGLKVVRSIVSKYDGLIDFTQEGDRFSTSVMLSL